MQINLENDEDDLCPAVSVFNQVSCYVKINKHHLTSMQTFKIFNES